MNTAVLIISDTAGPIKRTNGAAVAVSTNSSSGPSLKQLNLNLKALDKYNELLNFEMEVKYFQE